MALYLNDISEIRKLAHGCWYKFKKVIDKKWIETHNYNEFTSYLWGIETSWSWHGDQGQGQNSHPTYEELKLATVLSLPCPKPAFTSYLWGIETLKNSDVGKIPIGQFTSYLWGIETRIHQRNIRPCTAFTSYLWGIETHTWSQTLYGQYSFTSYLWGIETVSCGSTLSSGIHSHPTYEELKLLPGALGKGVFYIHILPMRNWNKYAKYLLPAAIF